ncbi:hypothetical protein Ddye_011948 [Dipteronia dyeriana]|uniref:DUF4371 domain-containing protein n=1 Tax=Dipteronia dyeriana TaxID=168575 RepID=A0AAE0CHY3_9ROSI|nr:hypothetical protein Ddye_011948 [Dipteronia dyeriana]
MGDALFSILVDESRDVSINEQMAMVLLYVNPNGQVVEWFIGIKHVASTTALSRKAIIDNVFSGHGLSISRLCGQGYDRASNMQGEFNGLKSLIMKENECAYYIHCFAHQLQPAPVALAKNHVGVQYLFNIVANVVNIVGASPKHRDILQDKQVMEVFITLKSGELSNGRGLNQETNLKRSDDTRWGSHYGSLISIITMFPSLIDVLEIIADDGSTSEQRYIMMLDHQLETYIMDMRSSIEFSNLNGISELAIMMVANKKDKLFPLVYLLLTLALILLVATATVERSFSAMKIIKTRLRNRMGRSMDE